MDTWPEEEVPINIDHPLLPVAIKEHFLEIYEEGDTLHRMVFGETIEWWVFSKDGELMEALWEV